MPPRDGGRRRPRGAARDRTEAQVDDRLGRQHVLQQGHEPRLVGVRVDVCPVIARHVVLLLPSWSAEQDDMHVAQRLYRTERADEGYSTTVGGERRDGTTP